MTVLIPPPGPPLPLGIMEANRQALRLRRLGMTYRNIAIVMGEYHGHYYQDESWGRRCRLMGASADPRKCRRAAA